MRSLPGFTRLLYRRLIVYLLRRRTDLMYRWLLSLTAPPDHQVLHRDAVGNFFKASFAESARQGAVGLFQELRIYTSPWGFELADIPLPVQLWHGQADRIVPCLHGRFIAARLPHCIAHFPANQGHYSLPIDHMQDILDNLLAGRELAVAETQAWKPQSMT